MSNYKMSGLDKAKYYEYVNEIVKLTNEHRAKAGIGPLTLENRLSSVAQSHSVDMALKDYFSHYCPDGKGAGDRITGAEYTWKGCAENIAAGNKTAAETVTQWMNSEGHRRNILNRELTQIGVGVCNMEDDKGGVNYHWYWTQVFATPA